jgi:hypothetical protein
MKICIIEPHADDAFLSVGGHIETVWKEDDVIIVTVFSGTRKRAHDARDYAEAVKSSWMGLGWVEGEGIDLSLSAPLPKVDRYILPLGVQHPEHILVRSEIERVFPENIYEYYVDQPYAQKVSNSKDVTNRLQGMCLTSHVRPNARKYRHIPLFKDQAKFFHYNPADVLRFNIEQLFTKGH